MSYTYNPLTQVYRQLRVIWITAIFLVACGQQPVATYTTIEPEPLQTQVTITPTNAVPLDCHPINDLGLPSKDLQNTHILYQGDNQTVHYEQIWATSMKDGSRKLLVDSPYLHTRSVLVFLRDGFRFLWQDEDSKVWVSDLDSRHPVQYDSAVDFLDDFPFYSRASALLNCGQFPDLCNERRKKVAVWNPSDPFLMIQDRISGEEVRVMQIPEQNFIEGAWSSYGEEFAFSFGNILGNVKDRYGQIYVVNADGSDLHLVTPRFESTSPRRPFWSPDGQKLAFWIWEPEHSPYPTIGVVTLATGEVNLLARGVPKGPSLVESTDLVWSPDSQWIAFTILSDQADIGALNVQSGEIYCITQDKNISEKVMDWR